MKPTTYPISLGPGLSMRPVEPADIEASHLLNLPPPVPTEVYRWLYFDNPFRNGRPTGWVVVHDDHGIVGKIWLIWWPARFLGEPIECVMGGDLFVDPRLRGAGAGVALVRHQFESFPEGLVLGSSANENSMGMWRKFQGFTVDGGNVRFQKLTGLAGALRAAGAGVPALRRMLAPRPGRPGRAAYASPPAPQGKGWRAVPASDPGLLEFLDRQERKVDLTARRDEAFLRWRYERCPLNEPRLIVTEGSSGIHGCLAMQVRLRPERLQLRAAEVIDFMVDFDDPAARRAVVEASLRWARSCGAELVEWRGTHPMLPRLFESGRWIRREAEINPFVCWGGRDEVWNLRSRSIHLVLGEGDAAIR